ncbi:unnamed protein product [Rotaria sp. Silwood2]|nr:unnamed protein product [Rotaria sp. Silwood2]CAF4582779.1 unnamed protein product [Rotaria sp. Silwood2]
MSLAEKLYLPAITNGMVITMKHFFKKSATVRYPEVKREISGTYRGQHVLKRDEQGAERCTACGLCAVACPAEAITMEAAERKKGAETLYREEKYAATYEINMLRCIFCGLCEEACPKEAIFLTDRIVPSDLKRDECVHRKDKAVEDINHPTDLTARPTPEVLEFKKDKTKAHNQTWADKQKLLSERKHH